jgi:hypothetical protein
MSPFAGVSRPAGRRGRWKAFFLAFAIFAVLQAIWAVATPPMGVPDEPAHVIRAAATARLEFMGVPARSNGTLAGFDVPAYIAFANSLPCYAFNSDEAASCQAALPDSDATVQGTSTANPNNPLYYFFVGLPSLVLSGGKTFLAMRLMSVLLTSALLGFMFMAVRQLSNRRWATISSAVAMTPMVFFLSGGVNPNGVEIAASGALLATLTLVLRMPSPGKLLWERGVIIAVSCLMLVTTRSIALLWLLIILLAVAFLADGVIVRQLLKRWAALVGLAASAVACVYAIWWLLIPSPLEPGAPFAGAGTSFVTGLQVMFDRTFDYGSAWIGLFGWIDTPAPDFTLCIWVTALGTLIVVALASVRGRARLALFGLIVAVFALPWFLQAATVSSMGYIWQGRYNLAMVLCLMLVVGIVLDDRYGAQTTALVERLVPWALWLLVAAHVAAFVWMLRRYVIGTDGTWLEMLRHPEWQPPGGWILLTLVYAAALAAAVVILQRVTRRGIQLTAPQAEKTLAL